MDLTHEYQRIGAIKGKILDADGSTVLLDIYQAFGLRKPKPRSLELGNPEGDLSGILADLLDEQDDALGNVTSTGSRAFCGKNFWAKLIDHPKVRGTYLNTLQAAQLRGDRRQSFEFGGVVWDRYRGKHDGEPFVDDGSAQLVPEGSGPLHQRLCAGGLHGGRQHRRPAVLRQARRLPFDKGVAGEAQSNPLHLCTRPLAVRELTL